MIALVRLSKAPVFSRYLRNSSRFVFYIFEVLESVLKNKDLKLQVTGGDHPDRVEGHSQKPS
jgi:hypothetical protein